MLHGRLLTHPNDDDLLYLRKAFELARGCPFGASLNEKVRGARCGIRHRMPGDTQDIAAGKASGMSLMHSPSQIIDESGRPVRERARWGVARSRGA